MFSFFLSFTEVQKIRRSKITDTDQFNGHRGETTDKNGEESKFIQKYVSRGSSGAAKRWLHGNDDIKIDYEL